MRRSFFSSSLLITFFLISAANAYSYSQVDLLDTGQIEKNGLIAQYEWDPVSSRCAAIVCKDHNGNVGRAFYSYDEHGFLTQAMVDDGHGDLPDDMTGATERRIIRFLIGDAPPLLAKPLGIQYFLLQSPFSPSDEKLVYEVSFQYGADGEVESFFDSRGGLAIKEASFDAMDRCIADGALRFSSDQTVEKMPDVSQFSEHIFGSNLWGRISDGFFAIFKSFQLAVKYARKNLNAELNISDPIVHEMEKIGKTLFGGSTYVLMGQEFEETRVHTYGEAEISDKVRVTFINGILNTQSMLYEALETISLTHGGVNVHHVFRPTEGWTWDISRAILIKTAYSLGFHSLHSRLLAEMWKGLIEEMGGVQGGGVIIHYAHSLGGTETERARDFLTPDEQKMIRVVTFGSSTLVPSDGYQSVINVVSVNDGVSSGVSGFIIDPLGHIRNFFDPESNVNYYGSYLSWPSFPFDHSINGRTYYSVLQELGKTFLEEFGQS